MVSRSPPKILVKGPAEVRPSADRKRADLSLITEISIW